jgi:hypothetical protein
MGLLSGLNPFGGGNSFSSGGIGNSTADKSSVTDNRNYATSGNGSILTPSFDLGDSNKISGAVTSNVNITSTDYGAVGDAISLASNAVANTVDSAVYLVDGVLSVFADGLGMISADNRAITESSMLAVSEANNNVTNVAADSLANSAYLSDSVIASTSALGGQFGADLAYLTDSAMTNNALLVDKTISTADMLTTQHQDSLNMMGDNLAVQAQKHSDDVGFLSQQSIQANSELTALFGGYLFDNSSMLNQSMLDMANLQEQSLDSALEVAGNVALNDNVEGIQNMVRYISIAAAVVGGAWALRKYA